MRITTEKNDIDYVLHTKAEIEARVKEMGEILTREYEGKEPIVVCILKGASFFFADLCREIKLNIHMDFIAVSSYGVSSKSTGVVRLIKDLDKSITGQDVIIVEDIIDSGLTLKHLRELFYSRKPNSIKTVCLLDRSERKDGTIGADMCGFKIPDGFVVGYGLDYADYYRNLPYIGVLKPEVYS